MIIEKQYKENENQCPDCGCIYDDKAVGTQIRDANCDCWCNHKSWWNAKGAPMKTKLVPGFRKIKYDYNI